MFFRDKLIVLREILFTKGPENARRMRYYYRNLRNRRDLGLKRSNSPARNGIGRWGLNSRLIPARRAIRVHALY